VYFLESTVINFLLFVLSDVVKNLCKFKCGKTQMLIGRAFFLLNYGVKS
jgi:hypothetical protein